MDYINDSLLFTRTYKGPDTVVRTADGGIELGEVDLMTSHMAYGPWRAVFEEMLKKVHESINNQSN